MGRGHLDADDRKARVILAAVMDSVSQIPQPGLQVGVVMLLDEGPVPDDAGHAADGRPLARAVEEADVDVRIAGEVVRLTGFGIGVEEEIDAAGFLVKC